MRFGSLCSGIEAATQAWAPLGWQAAWYSEIEPFCCAYLAHHYPDVPNLGDMTAGDLAERAAMHGPLDVLVAGTPCQAFSVAGLRQSLHDDRGNLTLRFVEIADVLDPAWLVWENVPGVLNTADNAFGCLLGGLVGDGGPLTPPVHLGKWPNAGLAVGPRRAVGWRVLDAQYFSLAQRRRRVFLVARRAGDGSGVAAVLFEPESLPRHTPPRREAGAGVARSVIKGAAIGRKPNAGPQRGEVLEDGSCYTLNTSEQHAVLTGEIAYAVTGQGSRFGSGRDGQDTFVGFSNRAVTGDVAETVRAASHGALPMVGQATHTLRGEGHDASEDGTGRGTPIVPISLTTEQTPKWADDLAQLLKPTSPSGGGQPQAVVFQTRCARNGRGMPSEITPALTGATCGGHADTKPHLLSGTAVRRLTPRECERLQGFPDDATLLPYRGKPTDQCPDGPRYKALGNSIAVPVLRWLGARIDAVAKLLIAREPGDNQQEG